MCKAFHLPVFCGAIQMFVRWSCIARCFYCTECVEKGSCFLDRGSGGGGLFARRRAHFTLHTSHFTLHTSHSTLHTSYFILHTSHSTLHTAHFTRHTLHCTLRTSQFHLVPRLPREMHFHTSNTSPILTFPTDGGDEAMRAKKQLSLEWNKVARLPGEMHFHTSQNISLSSRFS